MVIGSRLSDLTEVRDFLDEIFIESDFDRNYFNRVLLGLSEAVNNSILHGNGLNTWKSVFITARYDLETLTFDVVDQGDGFDVSKILDPTTDLNIRKESGRGIFLIRHFADDVIFLQKGRRVRIKYTLHK